MNEDQVPQRPSNRVRDSQIDIDALVRPAKRPSIVMPSQTQVKAWSSRFWNESAQRLLRELTATLETMGDLHRIA